MSQDIWWEGVGQEKMSYANHMLSCTKVRKNVM